MSRHNETEYGFQGPEIDLTPENLSDRKNVVRIFYKEMWDKANTALIPDIIHDDFTFRGSLGPILVGRDEFADYVRWVTGSIQNYTSDILELIEEDDKVSGKLVFHGLQRKELFGVQPAGDHIWWYGAPIFTFAGDKIRDLWVLGDINGLLVRAGERSGNSEFMSNT